MLQNIAHRSIAFKQYRDNIEQNVFDKGSISIILPTVDHLKYNEISNPTLESPY